MLINDQLPWYSAPDKPFPRRKYKCPKCLEMMKRSSNAQVEPALSEKKSQGSGLPPEKTGPNEVSGDKEVVRDDGPAQNSSVASKSWSDLLKERESGDSCAPSKLAGAETLSNLKEALDCAMKSERSHNVFIQPRGLINIGNVCFMNVVCIFGQGGCVYNGKRFFRF